MYSHKMVSARRERNHLLGAIEAISALVKNISGDFYNADGRDTDIDAITASMKNHTMIVIQMRPAVPLQRKLVSVGLVRRVYTRHTH
jgi:hypothetical protein